MPLLTFSGRERLRHPESICPIGRRVESDLALHAIAGVTQEGGRKSVQAQLIAPQRFRKCCSDPDFPISRRAAPDLASRAIAGVMQENGRNFARAQLIGNSGQSHFPSNDSRAVTA